MENIKLGKEAETFIHKFKIGEKSAREKFANFCSGLGGKVHLKDTYCIINKPISQVDVQLSEGKREWIAEFVRLKEPTIFIPSNGGKIIEVLQPKITPLAKYKDGYKYKVDNFKGAFQLIGYNKENDKFIFRKVDD